MPTCQHIDYEYRQFIRLQSKRSNEWVHKRCDLDLCCTTKKTTMMITIAMINTATRTMRTMIHVLKSPGLGPVVVGETVGTGSDTAATPTPNSCPHSHITMSPAAIPLSTFGLLKPKEACSTAGFVCMVC